MCQETRPVQVGPLEAPQHRRLSVHRAEPGEDAGGKPGRGGTVFLVAAGADNLVHGAECQAAGGQGPVYRDDPERQRAVTMRLLQLLNALAKRLEAGGGGHAMQTLFL